MSRKSCQEHTRFSFWVGDPFVDPERALFVGRYIERGPLSLEKFAINEQGLVNYFTADGQLREFNALDFLALLSCQIPKPHESLTRYYGHYSCRARGERRKAAAAATPPLQAAEPPVSMPSPARDPRNINHSRPFVTTASSAFFLPQYEMACSTPS